MPLLNLFKDKYPVFLAPMAGVTDAPFRDIVAEFGISSVVSEMVSSEALVRNSAKTFRRLAHNDNDVVNIVQIMGSDPIKMAESAQINEKLGAKIIDINMGCPAKKIVSNDSGSALMMNEDLAVNIAKCVVNSVKVPISIKMRLGWDFDHVNFLSLAQKFENVGVQMLTIHCRTRSQMYSGSANWSILKPLKQLIKIPYICNGDITDITSANNAIKESEANGIMIGRGALGKPWIPNQILRAINFGESIEPPSLSEQLQIVMKHFDAVCNFYGEIHGVRIFRKHLCWYVTGLPESSKFRENVNKIENPAEVRYYTLSFYSKLMS